ncbi:hypothetical protein SAMN06264364_1313 [Quadrisphaera granulorum]|uniref:Ribonuclease VapC n=1 Tax=Quadrisphaera granulorum TaxID=317664 RepID=A0A315ZSK5_9ACTN|nr:PIN domain nuclease [Quadrisphaera granulorum]PWJ48279.1 hypothetical protein BXY45_1313 [Quadrisphaera granulorum]SZE98440.1 hypothetical protein SAMN06264364_1313 [Quadrisphaera granulorum]
MALTEYMLDTSANSRLHLDAVAQRVQPLLERALIHTCAVLNLEALFSSQNADEYDRIWTIRNSIFLYQDTDERHLSRAQEVQQRLARESQHRGASLPDLIIAAVAEARGLTVLHYDRDYEHIAAVTGQATEWVAPPGSLP